MNIKNIKAIQFLVLVILIGSCTFSKNKNTEMTCEDASLIIDSTAVYAEVNIEGMTCEGCENAIKSGVTKLKGVSFFKVSHINGKARIAFDSSKLNIENIISKIDTIGYKAVSYKYLDSISKF